MPKYCKTEEMLADIGTKALSGKQFVYLRDRLTGYALVKKHHPTYAIPAYVLDERGNGWQEAMGRNDYAILESLSWNNLQSKSMIGQLRFRLSPT